MMRRLFLTALLLAFVAASSTRAQDKTNFSGRWTSDPLPADPGAARGRGAGRGPQIVTLGRGWGAT
jgi:hypothetical protein